MARLVALPIEMLPTFSASSFDFIWSFINYDMLAFAIKPDVVIVRKNSGYDTLFCKVITAQLNEARVIY